MWEMYFKGKFLPKLKYTYDSLWNITRIEEENTPVAQYTYDAQNQLTKAILPLQASNYVYDTYGNIRSKANYYSDLTEDFYIFSYEDGDWLDLLTKVSYTDKNGTTTIRDLTYDGIGNPLSYFNGKADWTFTWKNGRQLSTATSGSTSITNTYDVDGIRETKTVNGVKHTYTYLGEKLARETYGSNVIDYFYDSDGRPYKFTVKEGSTTYTGYFVLNLQGDVIAIIDSDGEVAVEYEYDAWGKDLAQTTSGSYGSKLCSYNALKYRGYYYDADLGLYYLNSRFYDAEIGRFINADIIDLVLASQSTLTDKNLYAYCDNNPISRIDASGRVWETIFDVLSLGASIMEVAFNPADPFAWLGLVGDAVDLIPFVTGVGETIRVLKTTSKVADGADDAIDTYRNLKRINRGNDLEVHHIVEKRLAESLKIENTNSMLSIALDKKTHRNYTNEWRKVLAYGSKYEKKQILGAAISIYSDNPRMLGVAIYTIAKVY